MYPRTVGHLQAFVGAIAILLAGYWLPVQAHGITERVSIGPGGIQGDGASNGGDISADGRFVTFSSAANNFGDMSFGDTFVRDRLRGTTERVSVGQGGALADNFSIPRSISDDGRFVVFFSDATNLVPHDTKLENDVFVRDRQQGTTERVSVGPRGSQGNSSSIGGSISADGRFIAFSSNATNLVRDDTNGFADVFLRDRQTGRTERISLNMHGNQGKGESGGPSISADGRFVLFASSAANLVPGDTNKSSDVFVRDRRRGITERISLGRHGTQGNSDSGVGSISADGRFAAFFSFASNLVAGDTNGAFDVFVRDRKLGTIERTSVGPNGVQGDLSSIGGALSADGRFVAFQSDADNLVPEDSNGTTDVFIRDRKSGTIRRVSIGPGGVQGDSASFDATISANGHVVGFSSEATNLVPGDTNGSRDAFLRTLIP